MAQLDVEIKQVFTVRYKDQIRKETAIAVLNAIQGPNPQRDCHSGLKCDPGSTVGVVAENDNRGGSLVRDITVIVKKMIDLENSERILKQVAYSVYKKSEFIGAFKYDKKGKAIIEVTKLEGVVNAEWKRVRRNDNATINPNARNDNATINPNARNDNATINPNAPSTLMVLGNADPAMVLATLKKFGTAYISR